MKNNFLLRSNANNIVIFLLFFGSLFLTACHIPHPGKVSHLPESMYKKLEKENTHVPLSMNMSTNKTLMVQYLGCGGLYFLKNGEGILIDPFFSNQKLIPLISSVRIGSETKGRKKVQSKKKCVDFGWNLMSKVTIDTTKNIKAIFNAHSHYDHLLDVPAIWKKFTNQPPVYVNRSGYNICYNIIGASHMTVLEDHMTTQETVRPPIVITTATGKINVYPVLADHNPHYKHLKAFDGSVTDPLLYFDDPYEKTFANDWLEGKTFNFLMDYLDAQGALELRVFVQSSSCNPTDGIPPAALLAHSADPKHPVDIAFLGVASYEGSRHYPEELLKKINPQKIVWIHWEDFFRRYDKNTRVDKDAKTVRATNVKAFFQMKIVPKETETIIPQPGLIMDIKY